MRVGAGGPTGGDDDGRSAEPEDGRARGHVGTVAIAPERDRGAGLDDRLADGHQLELGVGIGEPVALLVGGVERLPHRAGLRGQSRTVSSNDWPA